MEKIYRIKVTGRGYALSLRNMSDVRCGETTEEQGGNWIEVEEKDSGIFTVVGNNMTDEDNRAIGLYSWDNEVVDLDNGFSDEGQCFGMSNHLKWHEVDLTPRKFQAPSIERLKEALNHVAFCVWCPDDI